MLDELRREVLEANLEIARRNLTLYTWGSASGIDRERGVIGIRPSGIPYDALTKEMIVLVNYEARLIEGRLAPSTDLAAHIELYRAFPSITGVAHAHSPCACAWAQAGREIPCLGTTHADHFYGPVPITEPLDEAETLGGYEAAIGRSIVKRFKQLDPTTVPGVLCAHHGPFTWGTTPSKAVYNSAVLEECAKMAMWTLALSPATAPLDQELLDRHYMRKHGPGAYHGGGGDDMKPQHAIGVDFGTNTVRALIVDCANGDEIATAVHSYEHGEEGVLLDPADPNLARQHPRDYVNGLEAAVSEAMKAGADAGVSADTIVGIGVDTTGSTPIPVDKKGVPLAFDKQFENNLNAMAWLWKDHTAHEEAAAITERSRETHPEYVARCGGTYSSEWFWSKIWRCLKVDRAVFDAAHSWVECADFVPAWLCGSLEPDVVKRGVCPAGHKAMYAMDWGGLPDEQFLGSLAPELASLRGRLYELAFTSDIAAGTLSSENSKRLGIAVGTPVAIGAIDAHTGAVGAAVKPGVLVKVLGTSTCDMAVQPGALPLPEIEGLCGIVDGSILPGCHGLEAGQSAVGDIFNWFVKFSGRSHEDLTQDATKLDVGESGLLALDWHNGNRSLLVDPRLSGMLIGMSLHTTPADMYRAMIEATAFGARMIIDRLVEGGVPIQEVVCCGGIAEKNALLMQVYADVLQVPLKISRSAQTSALGSAVFGAVVGGVYGTADEAQEKMTGLKEAVYSPQPSRVARYDELYNMYKRLHDSFGIPDADMSDIMKQLIDLRARASNE